jgi:hypothetical protein
MRERLVGVSGTHIHTDAVFEEYMDAGKPPRSRGAKVSRAAWM